MDDTINKDTTKDNTTQDNTTKDTQDNKTDVATTKKDHRKVITEDYREVTDPHLYKGRGGSSAVFDGKDQKNPDDGGNTAKASASSAGTESGDSGNGSGSVSGEALKSGFSEDGGKGKNGGKTGTPSADESKEDTDVATADKNSSEQDDEYEHYCSVCRRPESQAGKMVRFAGNHYICVDCMQKSFDIVNSAGGLNLDDIKPGQFTKLPYIRVITGETDEENIPKRNRVKKKKKDEKAAPAIDINRIPAPHIIKSQLDEHVVGQEYAKKVMSVAVYNHYKRVACGDDDAQDVVIEKSNMLMIGPTGSGKTYMVKKLAELLDVPLAIADATSLTEAGYIGDDIESVVSKLLAAADNDVERAQTGMIFIDEIDKLAKKQNANTRDVSGEAVQQGLLKLLEGSTVEVPVGSNSKNAMVPLATVDTRNILFICGGAFPGLEDVIKERLNREASIGFQADLKDKYDSEENLIRRVTLDDLRKFGMIPEFLGRLPIVFTLDALTKDMLVKVLTEPKNAIIKQYQKLLAYDEVQLKFDQGALEAIAEKAIEKKTGARALRAIIEQFMLDIMYEIPKDDNIGSVTITRDYIEHTGGPVIEMRKDLPLIESAK